ncbi:hypothetical protein Adeg_0789 [Ammonifex degensii KC4]|uniref:Putative Flp pilus-assembly TadG-like N-terminal domain-containing protein n=1 Tax=Ammonifex degensii (strain DSM 10501 / KC4) TaxID=429009 RepID=C9RCF5_AMMDK|nr:pilus assembly protein TadG-related protein [Ammonifex degensii]ACX51932.1 hypothetical protein Adeg_0789 [Ammonifex degensii KC4]
MRVLKGEKGYALLYFAFLLPVLVIVAAWALDFTRIRLVKDQLWAACDAAAHAGAMEAKLVPGEVEQRVVTGPDGKPQRVETRVKWYRLLLDENAARQKAWEVFFKNAQDHGWMVDVTGSPSSPRGVFVPSGCFRTEAGSSTGRPDVQQDLYTVSAEARVRTYLVAGAVRLAEALSGRTDPARDYLKRGEVAVAATATAKVRVSGVKVGP